MKQATPPSVHRPDIDGLRAIAVLSVLLFHFDFTLFKGGFVGVDIFFVISGFLITRLIRKEILTTGTFRFGNFYLRRSRRLFPALFVTLLVSTVCAIWLFPPTHLQRFGGTLIHAMASVSNFFFWSEAGYFDVASRTKPLLHTWSLGIEEQFYLIWPLLLVLVVKKGKRYVAPIAIILLGAASFYLNIRLGDGQSQLLTKLQVHLPTWFSLESWLSQGESSLFFLLPFRVFEFTIGAALVWVGSFQFKQRLLNEALFALGLGLVLYSVFTFSDTMIFPSFNGLVPCFGAALLIFSGQTKFLGAVVRNKPFVWIGGISYSLYLVHWPLIVFVEYYQLSLIDGSQRYWMLGVAFILAYILHRSVEKPLRYAKVDSTGQSGSSESFALGMFFVTLLLVIPASNMWQGEGWLWRYTGSPMAKIIENTGQEIGRRHQGYRDISCWPGDDFKDNFGHKKCIDPTTPPERSVLLIGDSVSAYSYFGIRKALPDNIELYQATGSGCKPYWPKTHVSTLRYQKGRENCAYIADFMFTKEIMSRYKWVILEAAWERDSFDPPALEITIKKLLDFGVLPILVGPTSILDTDLAVGLQSDTNLRAARLHANELINKPKWAQLDTDMQKVANKLQVPYFSLRKSLCDDLFCKFVLDDVLLMMDRHHFTQSGATYAFRNFDINSFKLTTNEPAQ